MPDLVGEHWEEGWEGDLWLRKQHLMVGVRKESPFPTGPNSSVSALGRAGQHRRVQQVQPVLEELFPINHS